MPTYEYECTRCGELFELFQPITDRAKRTIKTKCKECNNKAPVVRRIGTGGGVIFKGSGFYQTDYRSESYKKAAEADKPAGESKPAKEGDAKPAKTSETAPAKKPAKGGPKKESE